jgi:hypothetical protein
VAFGSTEVAEQIFASAAKAQTKKGSFPGWEELPFFTCEASLAAGFARIRVRAFGLCIGF